MALTKAAKKAMRRNEKKRQRNLYFKRSMKFSIRALRKAIQAGESDKNKLDSLLADVYSSIDRAARRNIIHKNKAARKKAQIAKWVY